MTADRNSFPEPPPQSQVRVLRAAWGVTLTNVPDPDSLGADPSLSRRSLISSRLRLFLKGCGLLLLCVGVAFQVSLLVATVFFDAPMNFNGQLVGKTQAVVIQVVFLAFWVAFCSAWLVVVGKFFPAADQYWRLELGEDRWVLRQRDSRRALGRLSAQEIAGLTLDRQGRQAGPRRTSRTQRHQGPLAGPSPRKVLGLGTPEFAGIVPARPCRACRS